MGAADQRGSRRHRARVRASSHRLGSAMIASLPVSRVRQLLPAFWIVAPLACVLFYVLARRLADITHELALLGATGLFSLMHHSIVGWALIRIIPGDPVYTGAVASLLSDVDAAGLALAGPL